VLRFVDPPDFAARSPSPLRFALPETTRHGSHRALRQVLAAAVKWQWIERNVATDVRNPLHERAEFRPFESWEEVEALLDAYGARRAGSGHDDDEPAA
jgi:kynureninase